MFPAKPHSAAIVNIAEKLRESAAAAPYQRAVVFPVGRDSQGRVTYSHLTFQQLDRESDRLARGLRQMGVIPGTVVDDDVEKLGSARPPAMAIFGAVDDAVFGTPMPRVELFMLLLL